ncbi:tRNA dihydrouridine synthase DusB [Candidatus Woesearchaeota archaeon]|nr:tRNA dihydrouridine synthase DusB [Candidatus Woesearchaeota archaeon]
MAFPKIASKTILAPMAGINDLPYRLLCKEMGCGMTYSEMISAPALARKNKATISMIDQSKEERPFGLQLFGQKTSEIVKAAVFLEENYHPDVIDFNLGCPAAKIIRQGAGSVLMLRKSRVAEIVRECTGVLKTPFTVKIRKGFDAKKVLALEIAKVCEDAGAAAITVHPRWQVQGYSGKADWSIIKQVKELVSVPVIGNGDIFGPHDAARMMEETGCDYVMIGRGAMKNPMIFQQINDFLKKGKYAEMTDERRVSQIKQYITLAEKNNENVVRVKLHFQHFTTGMKGGGEIRKFAGKAKSIEDLKNVIPKGNITQ